MDSFLVPSSSVVNVAAGEGAIKVLEPFKGGPVSSRLFEILSLDFQV